MNDIWRALSRPVPRWVSGCLACIFVGLLLLIPSENRAEPPVTGDMILVPKDDLDRLQESHLAMLNRIAELEKALVKEGGRAEICTATWGGFRG